MNKLKQRLRPGLKLNTTVQNAPEEEKPIVITMNSSESYVIQNHPRYTDQSEYSYSTQKKYNQIFFKNATSNSPGSAGDCTDEGDAYYVIQKANGKEMQDKYKVKNPIEGTELSFFGVYDGHTTHLIAELLASKLDEYIKENLNTTPTIETAMKQAFMRMEKEVIRNLEPQRPRGGSTALCSVLHNKQLYSANLGDCQAVIIRGQRAVRLTNLHDFTNEAEKTSVEQKGGTVLKNRLEGELAISRSIGDINYKEYMNSEPEMSVYEVTEDDDFLLLGTDGFFNGLNPEQCKEKIEEFRRNENFSTGLKGLGDFLVEEAKRNIKTKKDNMTLILVDLREHFHKRSCKKPPTGFTGFF